MSEAEDAVLLGQWIEGDATAGTELFARHSGFVRRFFARRASSHADDLVQQTFLACLESARKFRQEASFRTFLIGIAQYKLLAQLRRDRMAELFSDVAVSEREGLCLPDEYGSIMLTRALQQLTPDLRLVLHLVYWEGQSQPEIARSLGVPVGTIASRVLRATVKLRSLLVAETHESLVPEGRGLLSERPSRRPVFGRVATPSATRWMPVEDTE